jgi:hypothetical protein
MSEVATVLRGVNLPSSARARTADPDTQSRPQSDCLANPYLESTESCDGSGSAWTAVAFGVTFISCFKEKPETGDQIAAFRVVQAPWQRIHSRRKPQDRRLTQPGGRCVCPPCTRGCWKLQSTIPVPAFALDVYGMCGDGDCNIVHQHRQEASRPTPYGGLYVKEFCIPAHPHRSADDNALMLRSRRAAVSPPYPSIYRFETVGRTELE